MKKKGLVIILFVSIFTCFGQNPPIPNDTFFYEQLPTNGEIEFNEIALETGDQTSLRLQDVINLISSTPGDAPVLRINSGTYEIGDILMKSNVHIRIDSDVVLKPKTDTRSIFTTEDNDFIENFSVSGVGGSFLVDLSEASFEDRIRVFTFRNIRNFRISDIEISDNFTRFSSLGFFPSGNSIPSIEDVIDGLRNGSITTKPVLVEDPNHPIRAPRQGIVENIKVTNAHYGFGLTQVQSGQNLLFRNLDAIGGVTLRLETGANFIQILEDLTPKLNEIYAYSIKATNGRTAVNFSPHTLDHDKIVVEKVTAVSCESAVGFSRGFVSNSSNRPEQNNPILGLTPGTFSNITVSDITATFGQNAQIKRRDFRFIPCEFRIPRNSANTEGISALINPDQESYTAPSLIPVFNTAGSDLTRPGSYNPIINNLRFSGYSCKIQPNGISYDAIDFEVCDEVIPGLNIFIPSRFRNTPNELNCEFCDESNAAGECTSLDRNSCPNVLDGFY